MEQALVDTLRSMNETMQQTSMASSQAVQQLQVQLASQQEALQAVMRENAHFMQAESSRRSQSSLVDARAVQRPSNFDGKEASWQPWSYKFSKWMSSQFNEGEEILDWAAQCGEAMIDEEASGCVREAPGISSD